MSQPGRAGEVPRVVIPRELLAHFEIGERIGDLLLKDQLVTQEQLAIAVAEQTGLRQKRVGDILVEQHIVSPDQLLQAIEQQAKMPMVRIGEALLALELLTPEQLELALAQQRGDRSMLLGELLVRKNVISRTQLQLALARKMGDSIVDVEPDAVRKQPYPVAERREAEVLDDDDRREVLWHTYVAVQREQLALGTVPDVHRTVLSRAEGLLSVIGALQLGALVGAFCVLVIFVVTRMILHLDFTRYLS